MKKYLNVILIVIIVILALEVFYLVCQNRKLRAMIANMPQLTPLAEGDRVPLLRAQDIDSQLVTLNYGPTEPLTVLFWFSATCSYCADNFEFWNRLYLEYDSDKLRFLGVCACDPDDARMLKEEYRLEFPVICVNEPYIISTYRGNVLPQTVLISPLGVIDGAWPGSLTNEQIDEILTALADINVSASEGGEKR
ncbi:MAG: redoxin domain-containing protein [candidate division Zixibacteria bacterium]|nr:redoxin domain-containing protein [candidate division Zixibacteria bacterium]